MGNIDIADFASKLVIYMVVWIFAVLLGIAVFVILRSR